MYGSLEITIPTHLNTNTIRKQCKRIEDRQRRNTPIVQESIQKCSRNFQSFIETGGP